MAKFKYEIGQTYELQDGTFAQMVDRSVADEGYETIIDEHGVHRYDRSTSDFDAGRVCGTAHDYSYSKNIKR
jgi:hypothetical protein